MNKVPWFLVFLFAAVIAGPLFSAGKIDGLQARLQYEPHLELNGNYELPPILIEFKHESGAGLSASAKDLTNGASVQILMPYFHTRRAPISQFTAPPTSGKALEPTDWGIKGVYTNVLTFDVSAALQVSITGNAAASFDETISATNYFSGLGGALDPIRSTSFNYLPTGGYNVTFDGIAKTGTGPATVYAKTGGDIHKGATFWVNRKSGSFIGYDPDNPPSEFPFIVISGLRIWTGPFGPVSFYQHVYDGSPVVTEDSTTGWKYGFHASKNTSLHLVTTQDNVQGAYRLVLRVSDDRSDLHWLGQIDKDSGGNFFSYDAKPFRNMFYVGGPRVSIDGVVNYNLFSQLSLPPGATSAFPSVSVFLPSGRITADGGPAINHVSYDSVRQAPGASSADGVEWNYLAAANNRTIEIRLTLPGRNDDLLWIEDSSGFVARSNLLPRAAIGADFQARAAELITTPTTLRSSSTNGGKSIRFQIKADHMFFRGFVDPLGSRGLNPENDTLEPELPASRWRDGPLSMVSAGGKAPLWQPANYIVGQVGNGGPTPYISEAISIDGLFVENFSSPLNPIIPSTLNLSLIGDEPARLYSQLGLQVFNDISLGEYYKAVADNFVIISGGPIMTMASTASNHVMWDSAASGGPLVLPQLILVHDKDDWINKEKGLKLSFKPNCGLYFVGYNLGATGGPNKINITVGNSNAIQADVEYTDLVKTSQAPSYGLTELARSVQIDMPSGSIYESDLPVVIASALKVTFDPVYLTGSQGWPLRFYMGKHQGTNGFDYQILEGNLLMINRDGFNIEAVLHRTDVNTVLANMVRGDNAPNSPRDLSCSSMRDRFFSTYDHVLTDRGNAVSMDAMRIVFGNTFTAGDIFIHLTSQLGARVGVGTLDGTKTSLHFAGSVGDLFNKVDLTYGTAGRYIRIRREFLATIQEGDDLIVTGLRYYPTGENDIRRLVVGYPDKDGNNRLATVTDSRIYSHQQVSMWLDRPFLANPVQSVSKDMLMPFPDIYVSHDARQVIRGVIRQDDSGDLRFALPGAGDNLQWSSDFSRIVYFFTTRDTASTPNRYYTYGSDGSIETDDPTVVDALNYATDTAQADANKAVVAAYVDTDIFPGSQGGIGIGIRAVENEKILGIDVVNEWPPSSTLRITGLMVHGLDPKNTSTSHINNAFPTYAELETGPATALLKIPGGHFVDNPLLGHLALNYKNNNKGQVFTQEPVYVAGPLLIGQVLGITNDVAGGATVKTMTDVEDNLGPLTVIMHEETGFEDPGVLGVSRGLTFDGIRLTFPHESPLRFLTADQICRIGNTNIVPLYENLDRDFTNTPQEDDYGGFARTVYLRFLYQTDQGEFDVFGLRKGLTKFPAGFEFKISGLSVTNVLTDRVTPGEAMSIGYTGYFPAKPGPNKGEWPGVDFGRAWRTPGLMLSATSAGAVDAYLYDGVPQVIVNSGSASPLGTSQLVITDPQNRQLFNACLISHRKGDISGRQ